jgi:hypothetical protein
MEGAWKSMQMAVGPKQWEGQQSQCSTRVSDGVEAVKNSSKAERALILEKFQVAKRDTGARQRRYRDLAERVMYEDEHPGGAERDPSNASSESSPGPSQEASTSQLGVAETTDDGDAAFARDMEVARKQSLAEQ